MRSFRHLFAAVREQEIRPVRRISSVRLFQTADVLVSLTAGTGEVVPVLLARSARLAEAFNQLSVRRFRPSGRDGSAFIQDGKGSIRGRGGMVSRTFRPVEPLPVPVGAGITGVADGASAVAVADGMSVDAAAAGKVDVSVVRKPGS